MIKADHADWLALGIPLDEVIRRMLAIDRRCIPGIAPSLLGSVSQWKPIYEARPETWSTIADNLGNIIGYWHFAPVFHDTYLRLARGQLMDGDLAPSALAPLADTHKDVYLYLSSFFIEPEHASPKVFWMLFSGWMTRLEQLAERGVFFNALAIRAVTPAAVDLCRHAHMVAHRENGKQAGQLFTLDFLPPPELRWLRKFQRLRNMYETEWHRRQGQLIDQPLVPPA